MFELSAQFPEISEKRAILMAMLKHLDDGVGQVVSKLKQEELFDNKVMTQQQGGEKVREGLPYYLKPAALEGITANPAAAYVARQARRCAAAEPKQ